MPVKHTHGTTTTTTKGGGGGGDADINVYTNYCYKDPNYLIIAFGMISTGSSLPHCVSPLSTSCRRFLEENKQ